MGSEEVGVAGLVSAGIWSKERDEGRVSSSET